MANPNRILNLFFQYLNRIYDLVDISEGLEGNIKGDFYGIYICTIYCDMVS